MKRALLAILLLLLGSCHFQMKKDVQQKILKHQWFQIQSWIPELADNYIFSNYFDDSLIVANHIRKIVMHSYYTNYNSVEQVDFSQLSPVSTKIFYFDEDFHLSKIIEESFEDQQLIGRKTIDFLSKEENGYNSEISISKENYDDGSFIHDTRKITYRQNESPNYKSFEGDDSSLSTIFKVYNPDLSSPISIDTMLNPKPKDWIMLMSNIVPIKIYRVSNKILENPVITFHYGNSGFCDTYQIKRNGIATKIKFRFNKEGYVNGYQYSVFTENVSALEQHYLMKLDNKMRPVMIYRNTKPSKSKDIITLQFFEQ